MKQSFTLLLFCLLFTSAFSQTPAWFSNVTSQVGLTSSAEALRLNVRDLNGDEYPDIVSVRTVNQRDMINVYLNVQDTNSANPLDRLFIDWTDSSGINVHPDFPDSTRRSEIVCFADVDNDGDPDAVSGIWHWDPSALNFPNDRATVMLNDGNGKFSHVPSNGFEQLGLISMGGLSFFDYNKDGNLDVYIATFSDDHPNTQFRKDYIMIGNGDGTFVERQGPFDLNTVQWPNYGSSVTDYDNDGWQDVFTSPYCRDGGVLWKNYSGAAFQNVAAQVNYNAQQLNGDNGQEMCQWGAYPYDFDNDGDMDLFQSLVHGGLDSAEGRSAIAVNQGPSQNYLFLQDLSLLQRAGPQSTHLGNMDASWVDLDNNMLVDLLVSETEYHPNDRLYVYIQDSTNHFIDETVTLNLTNFRAHTLESVDYDLDGDYDVILNDRDDGTRIRVVRNEIGNQNNWIGISLVAPMGVNYDCIGARVKVTAGGITQMRELQAGLGHWGGQAPLRMLFGLAGNIDVDSVEVIWPGNIPPTVVYQPVINEVNEIASWGLTNLEISQAAPLLLYPNPTTGRFSLEGWDFSDESISVRVVDLMGNLILDRAETRDRYRLTMDLSDLASGVYLVQVLDGNRGFQKTKRLVIQR